ncbi:MAG: uroporphyrinogen decarboxylase family protein [Kiritimatiellae bacterium]|nr:uroporphyrinogen decarboxylase family protein [Kiritimatiellia bacterium]
MNSKERCLAVLRGEQPDRTPVFPLLMSFAQKRAGISYREFATDGMALAEAQCAVRRRFPVDALTACSDAYRIAADLGAEMVFPDDKPPFASLPLVHSAADLRRLGKCDPAAAGSRMADRVRGVRAMARNVGNECLVLGWVDMPFAEACSLCGVSEFMIMLVEEPELAHAVLDFLTGIVIDFGLAQVAAGAPMIGAGDAAASLISRAQYVEFALPHERRVIEAVHAAGAMVKLHICGNTAHLLGDMVASGADLFNVDHMVPFEAACQSYGRAGLSFKGNLNPVADLFQSTPERCAARCNELMLRAAGLRYMLSPGCEVPGETDDAIFMAFCSAPQAMGQ